MSFGFGVLRLSSNDFWTMTPRELSAAYETLHGGISPAFETAQLRRLMAQFPDGVENGA